MAADRIPRVNAGPALSKPVPGPNGAYPGDVWQDTDGTRQIYDCVLSASVPNVGRWQLRGALERAYFFALGIIAGEAIIVSATGVAIKQTTPGGRVDGIAIETAAPLGVAYCRHTGEVEWIVGSPVAAGDQLCVDAAGHATPGSSLATPAGLNPLPIEGSYFPVRALADGAIVGQKVTGFFTHNLFPGTPIP